MRLLLTSNGLSDTGIVDALTELLGGDLSEARVAFVPTAANLQNEDKSWLVDDLCRFRAQKPACLDIVDLAALDTETVNLRLAAADVLVFGGGNPYDLLPWIERHGLREALPQMLEERVYVGISAGSMATCPHLGISSESTLWGRIGGEEDPWAPGLGYVDFYFRPHLGSPDFPTSQVAALEAVAARFDKPVYAADDEAAVMVRNGTVTAVGSGTVLTFSAAGAGAEAS